MGTLAWGRPRLAAGQDGVGQVRASKCGRFTIQRLGRNWHMLVERRASERVRSLCCYASLEKTKEQAEKWAAEALNAREGE